MFVTGLQSCLMSKVFFMTSQLDDKMRCRKLRGPYLAVEKIFFGVYSLIFRRPVTLPKSLSPQSCLHIADLFTYLLNLEFVIITLFM